LCEGPDQSFFQEKAREQNLTQYVHFLGHKSNPFSILAKAEILVLSSEKEGLPNIIIEALACGVPVISTDCISGPREILSPESNFESLLSNEMEFAEYGILYPVNNTELLGEALFHLLSNGKMRMQYVLKGLRYVKKYDKSTITKKYLEAFLHKQVDLRMEIAKTY
jgi:N-acetylgalactosamine-N,N'-diacetylbacillosaminyl-diphospho-undecaprenol 4-alpha-N-acetylgalactosaminyltransferase